MREINTYLYIFIEIPPNDIYSINFRIKQMQQPHLNRHLLRKKRKHRQRYIPCCDLNQNIKSKCLYHQDLFTGMRESIKTLRLISHRIIAKTRKHLNQRRKGFQYKELHLNKCLVFSLQTLVVETHINNFQIKVRNKEQGYQ